MRILLLPSFLLLGLLPAKSQFLVAASNNAPLRINGVVNDTVDIKKVITENRQLQMRMAALEKLQKEKDDNTVLTNKSLYQWNKKRASATLNTLDAADGCYNILLKSTIQAANQNVLAAVSNPQSGALGFKLTDVVSEKVKAKLNQKSTLKDKDRDNLIAGIGTLVNTVGSLLNPTSLVVQTVQAIAGFLPGRVKDAANDPTGQKFADDFLRDMKPYLDYYDKLQKENDTYAASLSRLESKYRSLGFELSDLDKEGKNHRVLSDRSTNQNIDEIFETTAALQNGFNFARNNENANVQYLSDINPDVYGLTKLVLEFHREYSEIVNKHFKESIALLETAKTQFPNNDAAIDRTKSSIVLPEADPTGFSRLLSTITNNLDDMRTRRASFAVNQSPGPAVPPRTTAPIPRAAQAPAFR